MKRLVKRILPSSVGDRLHGLYMIAKYHANVAKKQVRAKRLPGFKDSVPNDPPSVTIYVTNSNNRDPLELTLRTLFETTTYSNFQVVVADNNSTDGSIEFVESLMDDHPVRLLSGESKPQHEWYDYFMSTNTSEYWIGIHEDMMFLSNGWLSDLIGFMEAHPETDMLGGEYFGPVEGMQEPVSGEIVNLRESLSTWIFCVRTGLRERATTSFAFYKYWSEDLRRTIAYDQGGKLIEDMRYDGLTFACMPDWYTDKWQHIGNVTWAFKYDMNPGFRAFKLHQIRDMSRRLRRLRKRSVPVRGQRLAKPS